MTNRRPDADSDVSPEEKAAVLLASALALSEGLTSFVISDDDLERAHHAVIHVSRMGNNLIVDLEEK